MPKSIRLQILRSSLAVSIVLAMFAVHLPANQDSAKPTGAISVKQILDKNLVALGGIENLRAVQSLEVRGVFGIRRTTPAGDFVFLFKAPLSDLFEFDSAGLGRTAAGRKNGEPFFRRSEKAASMFNGVSPGALDEAWRGLLESDVAPYRDVKLVGLAQIYKKWAYALRFEPKAGDPTVHYYDSESFLLVRIETVEKFRTEKDGPLKAYVIDTDLQNYEVADNLRLPRIVIASSTDRDVEFRVKSVKTNGRIDDSKFDSN